MDHSEEMAKLRAIVEGTAGSQEKEKLDEMFFFPPDKSPEGQRRTNQPRDNLGNRGPGVITKDPKGYKSLMKGKGSLTGSMAVKDQISRYKATGPKGVLPEEDGASDELENLMRKYGVLEEGGCNMTAEGQECPVHGLEECGGYMEEQADEMNEANLSDEAAAQKIADKIKGTPNLTVPVIKQYVKKYLGMVGKNPSDIDFLSAHVHDILNGKGLAEDKKNKKPDADGDGIPDWADKNPKKKGGDEDRKDESVEESINITVDGAEAAMFINRMAELAGSAAHVGPEVHADMCHDCGCEMDQCTCDDGSCDQCGEYDCQCGDVSIMPMENADHDHGHVEHSPEGEPIDPATASWQGYYAPGTQSYVKGGDNPLIKEDADLLFKKLKGDYKAYVAEAELARSNAGEMSPLTANNRDEFDMDPFAGEEPVIDGTHSPLSTIKRQHVAK